MKSRIIWALIGLNLVLLAGIISAGRWNSPAFAQQRNRPADYLMIPGEVSGVATGVVYIVDTSNGLLGAMSYDDADRSLSVMPSIDLNRLFEQGIGAAGNAPIRPNTPRSAPRR